MVPEKKYKKNETLPKGKTKFRVGKDQKNKEGSKNLCVLFKMKRSCSTYKKKTFLQVPSHLLFCPSTLLLVKSTLAELGSPHGHKKRAAQRPVLGRLPVH